jgi:hypothetical protein
MLEWAKALVWSVDPRKPAAALPLVLMALAIAVGLALAWRAPVTAGEMLWTFDRAWADDLGRASSVKKCKLEARVELPDGQTFTPPVPRILQSRQFSVWLEDALPGRLVILTNQERAARALIAGSALARRTRLRSVIESARFEPSPGVDPATPTRPKTAPRGPGGP